MKDLKRVSEYHRIYRKEIDKIIGPLNEAHETIKGYSDKFKPVEDFIKSPIFLSKIDQINELSEKVRKVVETNHVLTAPAIQDLHEIYKIIDEASITEEKESEVEPFEDRERDIVRPVFTGVKSQIRRGTVSVKEVIPLSLPENTKWEDIQMRFVDPHNLFVEIFKHNFKITVDFNDMGMDNKLSKKPNFQWETLRGLAKYGEINWKTPIADYKVKKQKQLLAENLRIFFGIDEDPFELYQKEKAYRLKLNLIPNDKPHLINENKNFFNDTTSEIYDPNENR